MWCIFENMSPSLSSDRERERQREGERETERQRETERVSLQRARTFGRRVLGHVVMSVAISEILRILFITGAPTFAAASGGPPLLAAIGYQIALITIEPCDTEERERETGRYKKRTNNSV